MQRVGWIGLGNMGTPMAINLLKANIQVNIYVTNPNKPCKALESGANPITDLQEFVQKSQTIFFTLPDDLVCQEVFQKIACFDLSGKTFINSSTISVNCAKELQDLVQSKGGSYLDAPVSGSVKPASDGTLMFLISGQKKDYLDNIPFWEILGSSHFYLGDSQQGTKAKLAINYYMSVVVQGFAETITFAKQLGVDPQTMTQIVNQGACGSAMTKIKTPSVLLDQYPSAFPLKFMHKDLVLAKNQGWNTPLLQTVEQTFSQALQQGLADQDLMAVIKAIPKQS